MLTLKELADLIKVRFSLYSLLAGIILVSVTMPGFGQSSLGIKNENGISYESLLLRVKTLVRANVLDLAQSILETQGPPAIADNSWIHWERQLWTLYRVRGNWQELLERVRQIPPAFPSSIKREAQLQSILAHIELNDGSNARGLLRIHLLSNELSELDKRDLRKLLIQSYLADDRLVEASIAMKNYQSDYRSQEEDWLLLSARVYLELDDSNTAVNLLAPLDQPNAKLFRIYARLKNKSMSSGQGIGTANQLLKEIELTNDSMGLNIEDILAIIIYAKQISNEQVSAVNELERYLGIISQNKNFNDNGYPTFDVSDLLEAYSSSAENGANQSGLLVGDFDGWLQYTEQLGDKDINTKKSIYGFLLQNNPSAVVRAKINESYIKSLISTERTEIISLVYGEQKPFGNLTLSGDVGLELSNIALDSGNIELAAAVSQQLTEIPQGMDELAWTLHIARISIIAGEYEEGVALLNSWLDNFERLKPEQTDTVLQPVFDLQTVNQHKMALGLLHDINNKSNSTRHQREIAYWIAESYQATRQFIQAADYYLFSALQKDNGFDQWGESARYQAAQSLLSANLISDARILFEGLLDRANDDSRKIQLAQKVQELWLLESSLKNVEAVE